MEYDSPMGTGSGAAVLFGNSGGVMEAAVRTGIAFLTSCNAHASGVYSVDESKLHAVI